MSGHGKAKRCCNEHAEHCDTRRHQDVHHASCCDPSAADQDEDAGIVIMIGPLARQCRGMVDVWCLAGAVEPPPAAVDWQFDWAVVEWLAPMPDLLNSRDPAPPVPPPRV
jgi:hypothetical protein